MAKIKLIVLFVATLLSVALADGGYESSERFQEVDISEQVSIGQGGLGGQVDFEQSSFVERDVEQSAFAQQGGFGQGGIGQPGFGGGVNQGFQQGGFGQGGFGQGGFR
ncbi:hypothetical protein evm_011596 [Chilo suppressalis]|nr:hypothetical protein evm_011596 [Chilo suppressalis]